MIDNNLAYNFIKCLTEQENGQNAFILFSGIDGNKLNYENFKELFDILINRCQVFPKIDFYTSFKYLYFAKSDLHSPGIFNYLKDKQKNNFDRLFIASQSTRDIYCLIDKNSNDFYNTCNSQFHFIQFELKNEIPINGMIIFSSICNTWFPRSFDIYVNDEKMKSIKDANELNGLNKQMIINFDVKNANNIRIVFTDFNWIEGNYIVGLKRIELLSPIDKYSQGVFSTIIDESKEKDPHKCDVLISATNYEYSSFYLIDSNKFLMTYPFDEDQWFQVELTKGMALIHAIRVKNNSLKAFKIIATDDAKKPLDSWLKLIEIKEESRKDHKQLEIYDLDHPSPPVKIIRIIQTEPTWDNNKRLLLYHFDIFGYYI